MNASFTRQHSQSQMYVEERYGDPLVPESQHSVIVDFSTELEMLGDRTAVDVGLV